MNYDLEVPKIIETIKNNNSKRILLQLADGLKPEAKAIADEIKKETDAEVLIWIGSCYGACDIPLGLDSLKIDLVVQFGHNIFIKTKKW